MADATSIYDLSYMSNTGMTVPLSKHRGRPLLIVNTASKCGLTPQYEGLQRLHEEYGPQGLVVIGFPCDQFGHQEPGTDSEIEQFCSLNYGVTFPLSTKVDVNGANTHPVFVWLKRHGRAFFGTRIKWNFTKFLVWPDGQTVVRFAPKTKPDELRTSIAHALAQQGK